MRKARCLNRKAHSVVRSHQLVLLCRFSSFLAPILPPRRVFFAILFFFDDFLFRADTRGVVEGDRGGFFDANKLFCPTRSDTSEFGSESESKDTTKTGACGVEWLVSDWEKTGYRGGVVDGSENKGLSWGGDEYASNAAYSASYLALISSCLFALRRALVLSPSAAIAASVPVIFRAIPFLLGKLRSFGSLRGRGSCGSRIFRLFLVRLQLLLFEFWICEQILHRRHQKIPSISQPPLELRWALSFNHGSILITYVSFVVYFRYYRFLRKV